MKPTEYTCISFQNESIRHIQELNQAKYKDIRTLRVVNSDFLFNMDVSYQKFSKVKFLMENRVFRGS
jgi:hypothetical protein